MMSLCFFVCSTYLNVQILNNFFVIDMQLHLNLPDTIRFLRIYTVSVCFVHTFGAMLFNSSLYSCHQDNAPHKKFKAGNKGIYSITLKRWDKDSCKIAHGSITPEVMVAAAIKKMLRKPKYKNINSMLHLKENVQKYLRPLSERLASQYLFEVERQQWSSYTREDSNKTMSATKSFTCCPNRSSF